MKLLEFKVFPSEARTLAVEDDEVYGGAHKYTALDCLGFNNNETEYLDTAQEIQFIQKLDDGTVIPGLQSEQLAYILLDRCVKLNNRFPSPHNTKMIVGLNIFLEACHERVQERIERGVMGELKK